MYPWIYGSFTSSSHDEKTDRLVSWWNLTLWDSTVVKVVIDTDFAVRGCWCQSPADCGWRQDTPCAHHQPQGKHWETVSHTHTHTLLPAANAEFLTSVAFFRLWQETVVHVRSPHTYNKCKRNTWKPNEDIHAANTLTSTSVCDSVGLLVWALEHR